MIELRGITKSYRTLSGRNVVLDNVSLHIRPRDHMGILGLNGAGKSTLVRIIGRSELPDRGQVIRRGQISWPIGFSGGFNSSLSGEENCRFAARIYGHDVAEVTEFTREFAELGDYFYMPVRTYSSGMRAKLAFGVSMAIDFDMYLVDEITAVGDKNFRSKCEQAFADRRERAGLIMVSHQLETLKVFCTRCAVLEAGRLTVFDSVDDAADAYASKGSAAASIGVVPPV